MHTEYDETPKDFFFWGPFPSAKVSGFRVPIQPKPPGLPLHPIYG